MKQSTTESIERYVTERIPTGGFLHAVLSNNLVGAVTRADHQNLADLPEIVQYCIWNIPEECWGNEERVEKWVNSKRKVNDVNYE